jgi:hypothetical protein
MKCLLKQSFLLGIVASLLLMSNSVMAAVTVRELVVKEKVSLTKPAYRTRNNTNIAGIKAALIRETQQLYPADMVKKVAFR